MKEYIKNLRIWNDKTNNIKWWNGWNDDIMKIVKSLECLGLLLKGVSEAIQNETKEQKGGFLSMLQGTVGALLLQNMLAGKGINRTKITY